MSRGKILDGAQHSSHHVGILAQRRVRGDVEQRETCLTMNEKQLLDPIKQAPQHHHFRKTPAGPQGFPAPFQTAPRERVFERLVK